jgi:hypothetical protein
METRERKPDVLESRISDFGFGAPRTSRLRAWLYLVRLCLERQARARQMVWIAVGLLVVTATIVFLNTLAQRWGMSEWRSPRGVGPRYSDVVERLLVIPVGFAAGSVRNALAGSFAELLQRSGFFVFSTWLVFAIFVSFLLPIWSLSFGTEAIGGEREGRTLIWLLTQPLSRPEVYLAKFVALLPYTLGLNLGGFAVLCIAAGSAGTLALRLFWPAVLLGSLAFASVFHFMGACFRRPALVAIVYSFFLETVLGNMPGTMKRISIGFYTRCMMYESAQAYGVQPEKPSIFLPVDGRVAAWVLVALTVVFLGLGMIVFSRVEHQDLS